MIRRTRLALSTNTFQKSFFLRHPSTHACLSTVTPGSQRRTTSVPKDVAQHQIVLQGIIGPTSTAKFSGVPTITYHTVLFYPRRYRSCGNQRLVLYSATVIRNYLASPVNTPRNRAVPLSRRALKPTAERWSGRPSQTAQPQTTRLSDPRPLDSQQLDHQARSDPTSRTFVPRPPNIWSLGLSTTRPPDRRPLHPPTSELPKHPDRSVKRQYLFAVNITFPARAQLCVYIGEWC